MVKKLWSRDISLFNLPTSLQREWDCKCFIIILHVLCTKMSYLGIGLNKQQLFPTHLKLTIKVCFVFNYYSYLEIKTGTC